MTTRDFAYWLQGFFEVSNPEIITKEQTDMIKKHLNLVFFHEIDPSYTDDPKKQEQMNEIHNNGKPNGDGLNPVHRC
jgi:hypothetical protein